MMVRVALLIPVVALMVACDRNSNSIAPAAQALTPVGPSALVVTPNGVSTVGADRSHQLDVAAATDAGHVGTEMFRELHGERPDPARRSVDQHALAACDAALAQTLQGDHRLDASSRIHG